MACAGIMRRSWLCPDPVSPCGDCRPRLSGMRSMPPSIVVLRCALRTADGSRPRMNQNLTAEGAVAKWIHSRAGAVGHSMA
jgi:hypothetical protein